MKCMYLLLRVEDLKIEYQLVTANTGYYKATTRIGGEGKFDTYETPDIKHLLEKSGMNNSDITM